MKTRDPFQALAEVEQPLPLHILEALRAEMGAEPARAKSGPSRTTRLIWSAIWLFAGLVLSSWKVLTEKTGLLLGGAALFGVLFGGVVLGGVVPGSARRLGLDSRRWLLVALGAGLWLVLAWGAERFLPLDEVFAGPGMGHTLPCASHALLSGLLGGAGLLIVWRGTDPFTPGWTGALLGGGAGILGAISVGFACASSEGWHLTVAHGSSILLLSACGAWCGARWLRP